MVAKDGDKIAKVQCKQCGGYHRYKSVAGATANAKKPAATRAPKESTARTPVERFEKPAVAADLARPPRTYRAADHFDVGDRVEHPSFGQGVVELSEPGKITVFFGAGRRVLAQAKEAPTSGGLERPKPFDHSRRLGGGKPVSES